MNLNPEEPEPIIKKRKRSKTPQRSGPSEPLVKKRVKKRKKRTSENVYSSPSEMSDMIVDEDSEPPNLSEPIEIPPSKPAKTPSKV